MSTCSFICPTYTRSNQLQRFKIVKARKQYECGECRKKINIGERYERYTIVSSDGCGEFKTCLDCVSLRDTFCKGGSVFGGVRDQILECIYYDNPPWGQIAKLTKVSRDWICDKIEKGWEKYYVD